MTKYDRLLYYMTVFLTGFSVLVVEVAAVRLLAPYFGASLYVLSSVLTIILFALAVGYVVGGRLADRFPYPAPLFTIIIGAGVSLLGLTALATYTLPHMGTGIGLAIGPLFAATLFFFLPAFLLGIDSPYVITLLTRESNDSTRGAVVGTTFFWSTAGSIVGSISAGFYLLPTFGITQTLVIIGTGIIMLGCGVGPYLQYRTNKQYPRGNRTIGIPFLLITSALISVPWLGVYATSIPTLPGTLYQADGYYGNMRIYDGEYYGRPARFLKRDTNAESAIFPGSQDIVFSYLKFFPLYKMLVPNPERFLLVGGGAYTAARYMHYHEPTVVTDVVEIEPRLFTLAHTYFELPVSDRIRNFAMDARPFIRMSTGTYDVILLDAFNSGHFIPPHLVTREFFTEVAARLHDDGVLVVNFIGDQKASNTMSLTGSFFRTFTSVFPNTVVFTNQPQSRTLQNFVLIAHKTRDPQSVFRMSDTVTLGDGTTKSLQELVVPYPTLIHPSDEVFTDNHSRVEWLLARERF
jgi:spermidine synthase